MFTPYTCIPIKAHSLEQVNILKTKADVYVYPLNQLK